MFCFTGISVMQDVNVILIYQVVFKSPRIVKYLNYFLLQIHQHDNIANSCVSTQQSKYLKNKATHFELSSIKLSLSKKQELFRSFCAWILCYIQKIVIASTLSAVEFFSKRFKKLLLVSVVSVKVTPRKSYGQLSVMAYHLAKGLISGKHYRNVSIKIFF